jgi:membrane-associated phospholipid phosphatase
VEAGGGRLAGGCAPARAARLTVRRDSDARFGARAVLAAVALALVAVPFGLLLFLVEDKWRPLLRIDEGARDELHAYAVANDGFVDALRALSTVGSIVVYGPLFTAIVIWLAWRRLPRLAIFVAVTISLSPLLNGLVKGAVDRARPVFPDPVARASGLSFPSGHAQSSVVVVSLLLLVFLPRLRGARRVAAIAFGVAWIVAMGLARVGLGVHYVSDVLAGYVLGAAWVAAMVAAFNLWRRERGRAPADASEGLEPELAR